VKILILGAASRLGPHVADALGADHELILTDIVEIESQHKSFQLDISSQDEMNRAMNGVDAVINCTVERRDRKRAFDVNTLGCYNMMRAAVEQSVTRVINTGPHFTVQGPSYENYDYGIGPDASSHPGVNLYAHSKGIGQEICRVFAEQSGLHLLMLLFYIFRDHAGKDSKFNHPHLVTWRDAAQAVRCAIEVDLETLPSRCEVFSIFADLPHGRFSNEKAKRVLGWQPQDDLREHWTF
jgi:nucleoside-diphosphate-sugar epimerase